jgi:hypothetical protein
MPATLRLTRRFEPFPYARQRWPIMIDGAAVGAIDHGQTVELKVEPGDHTLQLGSTRHRSPERSFTIAEGEVASFRSRRRYGVPAYLIALFKPDFWISLHPE